MSDERDIWATASMLLRDHGKDASVIAGQRQDASMTEGNLQGHLIWRLIGRAIDELQRCKPNVGEGVH